MFVCLFAHGRTWPNMAASRFSVVVGDAGLSRRRRSFVPACLPPLGAWPAHTEPGVHEQNQASLGQAVGKTRVWCPREASEVPRFAPHAPAAPSLARPTGGHTSRCWPRIPLRQLLSPDRPRLLMLCACVGCGLVLLVTTPHPTFIPRVGTNVVCWNGRQTMRQTHQASPASRRTRKRLVKEIKKEHRPARAADLDRSSPAECSADCCLASCSHQRPADGTSPAARPSVLSVATVQAAGRGCCSSVKGHAARLVCVTTLLACSELLTCALVRSLVCRTRGAAQTVS